MVVSGTVACTSSVPDFACSGMRGFECQEMSQKTLARLTHEFSAARRRVFARQLEHIMRSTNHKYVQEHLPERQPPSQQVTLDDIGGANAEIDRSLKSRSKVMDSEANVQESTATEKSS